VDISPADVEAIKAALLGCKVDFKPMADAEKAPNPKTPKPQPNYLNIQ